ncbi:MAG: hypothetical protein HQM09_19265 [Candidatus Riflebacteria bacterium]|nr:hypothetical protein [Candidatus Riflebacteria bacterium]
MKRLILAFVGLMILFCGNAMAAQYPCAILELQVYSGENDEPVADAQITLKNLNNSLLSTIKTDSRGYAWALVSNREPYDLSIDAGEKGNYGIKHRVIGANNFAVAAAVHFKGVLDVRATATKLGDSKYCRLGLFIQPPGAYTINLYQVLDTGRLQWLKDSPTDEKGWIGFVFGKPAKGVLEIFSAGKKVGEKAFEVMRLDSEKDLGVYSVKSVGGSVPTNDGM